MVNYMNIFVFKNLPNRFIFNFELFNTFFALTIQRKNKSGICIIGLYYKEKGKTFIYKW